MMRQPMTRRSALQLGSAAALAGMISGREQSAHAALPRAVAEGQLPPDSRLGDLKDLNGYFPWTPSKSTSAWTDRAEYVRRQVLIACGLWPMPARLPIEATVHGKVERDGYTVEKVVFESHPGLYVTGSLYRPTGRQGKRPGVLCPHGHWANGRFYDHGEAKGKQEIELGAEKFASGRYPLQARCVHLARMGCVVFMYDMLGYADSTILSQALIHGFAKQRPEMSQPDHWGLFSAQSELRLLNGFGLQAWNSVRALDWFATLDDVDAERIGVTGASGGGTQTFILGAIDPRPAAFFPAVMVSTAMQGGCTCENATYLRVGTGNIELTALIAPRPVGMTGAKDWTVDIETKGLPELKQHYALLGVPDRVSGKFFPFEHNYNHPSRTLMYEFFQKTLGLDGESTVEQDFVPLTREEITVWDAAHPQPLSGDEAELKIVRSFAAEYDQQFASLLPVDAAMLAEYRKIIGGGWDVLVGRRPTTAGEAEAEAVANTEHDGYQQYTGLIRNTTYKEACPSTLLLPAAWNGQLVIWLTDQGKAGLFDAGGSPIAAIKHLLKANTAVAGIDLLYQGEFLASGETLTESRRVKNPRDFLGYTTGYNHPLPAQRVHDVMSFIVAMHGLNHRPSAIHLVGLGDVAPIAAAAAAQAAAAGPTGAVVQKLAVSTGGFRYATLTNIRDPKLWPGAVRYGDLPGLLALCAPKPLWLHGEGTSAPRPIAAAYLAAGQPSSVQLSQDADEAMAAAKWLNE